MKKVILSVVVIGLFAFYSLRDREEGSEAKVIPSQQQQQLQQPQNQSFTSVTPAVGGTRYKDGQYIGTSVDAFYGPVQVKAVISGGKITDVQFLQFPNDRETSLHISNDSMPILKSEAIANQTAKVDIVTGATQTSEGFQQSLQSALDQAKS